MNVIIKIKDQGIIREAIPVRALPLLAEWGTMNPEKIAGAFGRVTDDDRHPLFGNLHDMNSFYIEDGTVHPVAEHHWRDHTCRQLEALNDQLRRTEISHSTGHVEWRVKALEILPKDVFVWKDEYEPIYDRTYGPGSWAHLSDDSRKELTARGKKPPPALKFRPRIANGHMETLVQDALDAIRSAADSESVKQVPLAQTMETVTAQDTATPASVATASDGPAPAKRSRKPSWSVVAMPYMRALYSEGRYKSASVFYKALLQRADVGDSPFTKLNGCLYCKEAGTTVAEGTVGSKWKEVRNG